MAWSYPLLSLGWEALKFTGAVYWWAFKHPRAGFLIGAAAWTIGKRKDWDFVKRFGGSMMVWSIIGYGWNEAGAWYKEARRRRKEVNKFLPWKNSDYSWWEIVLGRDEADAARIFSLHD